MRRGSKGGLDRAATLGVILAAYLSSLAWGEGWVGFSPSDKVLEPPPVAVPLVVEEGGGPWGTPLVSSLSTDELFLRGLRRRGLYELAESHCRRLLASPNLSPRQKVSFTVELALALADRGFLKPEQREALFSEADKLLEALARELAGSLLGLLVRFERARLYCQRGVVEKEEGQASGSWGTKRQTAEHWLKKAVDILNGLRPEIEEAIRTAGARSSRSPEATEELSLYQLAELAKAVLFEKGTCLLSLGEIYPDQSADQAAFLAEAEQLFAQLASLPDDHPWAWPSRWAELRALRLLRNFDEAQARLSHWQKGEPARPYKLLLEAEGLRLLLAQGKTEEAARRVAQIPPDDFVHSAELAVAAIEVTLAAWQTGEKSTDKEQAERFAQAVRLLLDLLATHHSGRDLRRARSLVARQMPELTKDDLALAEQAAEHAYHAGQLTEALAAYDRAVELALRSENRLRAWELALAAANIAASSHRVGEACGRYRLLALWQPDHPQAAEVHLLAIAQAGKLVESLAKAATGKTAETSALPSALGTSPACGPLARFVNVRYSVPTSATEALALCEELAGEHLRHWPAGPSADRMRILKARLLKETGRILEAGQTLAELSPRSPQFPQAVDELRSLWGALRATGKLATKPDEMLELALVAERWISEDPAGLEGEHLSAWMSAGLMAVRGYLEQSPPDTAKAEALLGRLLAVGEKMPAGVLAEARSLLLATCFWEGRTTEVLALAKQLAAETPAEFALFAGELWDRLSTSRLPVDDVRYRLFGQVADLLRQHAPDQELKQKADLLWLKAGVYGSGGAELVAEARRLAAQRPEDPEVVHLLARLLLAEAIRQLDESRGQLPAGQIKEAREVWRQIESQARAYSEAWYQAKAALALLAAAEGHRTQAEKIVRLARMLDPQGKGLKHPAVDELLRILPPSAAKILDALDPR